MQRDWDERYIQGNLPWDTGIPDAHLVEFVESGTIAPGRALEIGCGTGTNAIWLSKHGFQVHAFDLAGTAIAQAQQKREAAGVQVEFAVRDILTDGPPHGSFDFVFDRGVFHVFDDAADRSRFAAAVAEALAEGGHWLSLIGSTEGPVREHGPPRRSARDILDAVEPVLELVSLRTTVFHANIASEAMAWLMLARHRASPAQPSTVR